MLVLDAPCFRRPNLLRPGEWWSILWPQQLNLMREETAGNDQSLWTTTAVLAHENELCSRNMVLSCTHLMQQHESSGGRQKNEGQHLVISAMDAF
jgi:hypothetical protein